VKYRHAFHAGNFADVHKHVTLLALLRALQRKDKGFLYLETHAGGGRYDLAAASANRQARAAVERVVSAPGPEPELADYAQLIRSWRTEAPSAHAYPGSPLIAALALRAQDRAVLIELEPEQAHSLERSLPQGANAQVIIGDGFELLRAHLPPPERRGLMLIDPPYEEPRADQARIGAAIAEGLRRLQSLVIAVWYPIKDARDTAAWLEQLQKRIAQETLVGELWLHPCDSRVALNGSGMLIVNPPYGLAERMPAWLAQLRSLLDREAHGGESVRFRGNES